MITNKYRIIKRYNISKDTHIYHLQQRIMIFWVNIGWKQIAAPASETIARSWMLNLQAFVYEECPITKELKESVILTKDQEIWRLARQMAWKEGVNISYEEPDFSLRYDPWYLKARDIFEWVGLK